MHFLVNNFNLNCYHSDYPTIDHKFSIFNGFINNISPKIISEINNLCYTKRINNNKKSYKNEEDFII